MINHHRGVLVVDNDEDVRRTISRKVMNGDAAQIVSHLLQSPEARTERVMIMTAGAPNVRKIDRTLVRGVLFKPLDYGALTAQARAMLS